VEAGMTGTEVLDSARDAIMTIITISAPLLIVGTIVGVTVSLFQALTQIQEQKLVFVPKILATFATFLVALPFMAETLNNYMVRTASLIAFHK
jgi:flagellar biosynthesis protein FliQ